MLLGRVVADSLPTYAMIRAQEPQDATLYAIADYATLTHMLYLHGEKSSLLGHDLRFASCYLLNFLWSLLEMLPMRGTHAIFTVRALALTLGLLCLSLPAHADVVAPQAPPELSDTLTDFRTKEQLSEQVYIEGKSDPQNSLNIPTVPGDLEAKVMRMSATYLPQYEVAVPRHGVSILRFYDLNGYPMEIVSTRLENQGFLVEVTASPSELMIRQFQGAATTLLQVRLKGINKSFIFTLKPLVLVNQQSSVRTLLTAMTVNYYVEGANYIQPQPYKFGQPNPQAQALNFDKVQQGQLERDLVSAAAIVMPLTRAEQDKAAAARDALQGES